MKHIRPVSVARAQIFIIFAREINEAISDFAIAKKNTAQTGAQ